MEFELLSEISDIEIIAVGNSIRILPFLRKRFGKGRWRKLKGNCYVKLTSVRLKKFLQP